MDHHYYLGVALAEAQKALQAGEIPVGAVVVSNNQVIASGFNLKETRADPTAHAEIIALRGAARALGRWRMPECTLYVTLEPCCMCAGAIISARIKRLVYGVDDPKAGAAGSVFNIVQSRELNHTVEVIAGIREEECKVILQDFFQRLR